MGMTNNATARDANSENTTVNARSPKICPATPCTNTMGKNTAMVVKVDAMTAGPTSLVPRMTDVRKSSPSSRQRKILSVTTIALSTNIPIPSASPPSDMMFRETLNSFMAPKVAIMEMGIASPTIKVLRKLFRKRNRTITASNPPCRAVFFTSSMEFLMNTD